MAGATSTSLTVFSADILRPSAVFQNYPWYTDILLGPGSLEANTARWLEGCQNVSGDMEELCRVKCICIYFFHKLTCGLKSLARTLDGLTVQNDAILARKNVTLATYFTAPITEIIDEKRWAKSDSAGLMGAAHLLSRHALLDRLVFSVSDTDHAVQLLPRSELPHGTFRLREVCLELLLSCQNLS
jgi:hypothetical protein